MARIVYLNDGFVSEVEARISIFDRGFLFADSAYEVTAVLDGKLVCWAEHFSRLQRSLDALGIMLPLTEKELLNLHRELIKKNNLVQGIVYLQVSRGCADRNFIFSDSMKPTIVLFSQREELLDKKRLERELRVVTVPDKRWGRRDIKTTQLLYSSMVKTEAKNIGKDDAWLIQDGLVTEGTSNNIFIIDKEKKIITRDLSNLILAGVTRSTIITFMEQLGLELDERPFTLFEAQSSSEAFITSATNFVTSVVEIDDKLVADGKPGPLTKLIRESYISYCFEYAV